MKNQELNKTLLEEIAPKKNFQSCANLEIEMITRDSKYSSVFEQLLYLQLNIQTEIYGHNFLAMQIDKQKAFKFLQWNVSAIEDELRELLNSFGGITQNNGEFWKPWKSAHKELIEQDNVESLCDSKSRLEMKFEMIDIYHFLNNILLLFPQANIQNMFRKMEILRDNEMNNIEDPTELDIIKITPNVEVLNNFYHTKSVMVSSMNSLLLEMSEIIAKDSIINNPIRYAETPSVNPINNDSFDYASMFKLLETTYFVFDIFCMEIGLTSSNLLNLYYAKNKENINRQKNKY